MQLPSSNGSSWSRDRWILMVSGCLALVPYAMNQGLFGRLFWFGDELDQIDQIDRIGFWNWIWVFFGENFCPLFKALWGAAVLAFGGSYAAMIAVVWLTHALNVALLGRLMRSCGLPWAAVFCAQVLFGLTPANIEVLAWSIQWSSVLSVTFMLLALDSFFRSPLRWPPLAWAAASGLSFARGVLTGPVLAFASLFQGQIGPLQGLRRRVGWAAAYLSPSLVLAFLITALARGNHQHMTGHVGEAAVYAVWYYCLNPSHYLLAVESWGWRTMVLLGLLKLALVGWALARSGGRQRMLFALLVAFDLGYAVLLGIGRYHTGLATTVAPRYQYASLIGIAPLAAYWFSWQCERFLRPAAVRAAVVAALLLSMTLLMCRQWSGELEPFTRWRGTDSRRILFLEPAPDPHSVPGIPSLPMDRAKELIAKYNLH